MKNLTHLWTVIQFMDEDGNEWKVEYRPKQDGSYGRHAEYTAYVYYNGTLEKVYNTIPEHIINKSRNANKTQAREIIKETVQKIKEKQEE